MYNSGVEALTYASIAKFCRNYLFALQRSSAIPWHLDERTHEEVLRYPKVQAHAPRSDHGLRRSRLADDKDFSGPQMTYDAGRSTKGDEEQQRARKLHQSSRFFEGEEALMSVMVSCICHIISNQIKNDETHVAFATVISGAYALYEPSNCPRPQAGSCLVLSLPRVEAALEEAVSSAVWPQPWLKMSRREFL